MSAYYPVFVDIRGKRCVVVGGGKVAERKVSSLLKAQGEVTVISDILTNKLKELSKKGKIRHIARKFVPEDIEGAFLVVAATSDQEANRQIANSAPFLVNVVDNPGLSNFIVPSVIRKGPLTIAVSTSGISPAFSARIRRDLERLYGRDLVPFFNHLKRLRTELLKEVTDPKLRRLILRAVASPEVIEKLQRDGLSVAKAELTKKIQGLMRERTKGFAISRQRSKTFDSHKSNDSFKSG